MRVMGGIACAHVAKVIIDTDGVSPFMGGKEKARGGEGFHEVIMTGKDGMARGRENP